jgi:hypothetical protein
MYRIFNSRVFGLLLVVLSWILVGLLIFLGAHASVPAREVEVTTDALHKGHF